MMPTPLELPSAWNALMSRLGAPEAPAQAVFDDLCRHYSSEGRFYHTLFHVANVLKDIERGPYPSADLDELRLAVWFHDAVYDTQAGDNEERSAEYAAEALGLLNIPMPLIARVCALILTTKTHQAPDDDLDGKLLLDADLAILGANPHEYGYYRHAIRREYAWVPDEHYRAGRIRVLETFLQRPTIYLTAPFVSLEPLARNNLHWEIENLQR